MWARNGQWILPEMPDFHVAFRYLLHAVNLQHGTDGFTSPPKDGVLRIFSPWKIWRLWPGLNPRTWVPKASTLPLDHRSHYCNLLLWFKFCLIKNSLTWIFFLCLALLVCASKSVFSCLSLMSKLCIYFHSASFLFQPALKHGTFLLRSLLNGITMYKCTFNILSLFWAQRCHRNFVQVFILQYGNSYKAQSTMLISNMVNKITKL